MSGRARTALVLLAALVVGLVAACGVPQDDEPRLIAEEPEGLATTSQPAENRPGEQTVQVFLIDRKESVPTLAGRDRTTELRPTALGAVDELLAGTTDEDEDDDYATAIPGNTGLLPESRAGEDIIVLDLSGEFANVAGDLSLQAYAQLVYTATQYDRSTPVRFQIEGKSVSAPTDEGQKDAVRRSDYLSLRP